MTIFFQKNTIRVILKNALGLPSFIMAVKGGKDFEVKVIYTTLGG